MTNYEENAKWVLSKLRHPTKWWHVCSAVQFGVLGLSTKIFMEYLSKTQVYNKDVLIKAIDDRPKGTPLITVANHYSCIDDPAIWGVLRLNQICNKNVMRWGMAAHNICYTELSDALLFLYGKGIPVVRGDGVFQPAMNLCLDKLKNGDWLHMFAEGKVNMTQEVMRFKWGIGRLINESPTLPIVVPIWHIGMDVVLPNDPPYIPQPGKRITINVGRPLDLTETVEHVKKSKFDDLQARKFITDEIQEKMFALRYQTEKLHNS